MAVWPETRLEMRGDNCETWLGEGEKYAMLGLSIKSDQAGFTDEQVSPNLAMLTRSAF
jgi:hypothetical protein